MMSQYLVPGAEVRCETRAVNSRFIAAAGPAFTVEAARAFVDRIRREFPDASHHVAAYLVGHGSSVVAHCGDDGEPSGTAGRPVLAVLRGSGLGDVVVVVTRYFGGTKLGTGGLVRAYGGAVRAVLEVLPRAVKVPTHTVVLAVPYSHYEQVRNMVEARRGVLLDSDFGAEVTLTARFAIEQFSSFQQALSELSGGSIRADVVETNQATIMPPGRDGP